MPLPSQVQVNVGAHVAQQICLEYVDAYIPNMFKGSAEDAIKEHPELFNNIALHVYEAMSETK